MPLTLQKVLGMRVDVNNRDPILQEVSNQSMIKYLTQRDFHNSITHDSGLAAYQHSTVEDKDGNDEYLFDVGIDTNDDGSDIRTHATNVKQFLHDMQRFYELKDESHPTQLQILDELV